MGWMLSSKRRAGSSIATCLEMKPACAGGAPFQWRVMVFRTAGILPAHES